VRRFFFLLKCPLKPLVPCALCRCRCREQQKQKAAVLRARSKKHSAREICTHCAARSCAVSPPVTTAVLRNTSARSVAFGLSCISIVHAHMAQTTADLARNEKRRLFSSFPCPPGRLEMLSAYPNALPSTPRCPRTPSEMKPVQVTCLSPTHHSILYPFQ
jgi:hypothetical protein